MHSFAVESTPLKNVEKTETSSRWKRAAILTAALILTVACVSFAPASVTGPIGTAIFGETKPFDLMEGFFEHPSDKEICFELVRDGKSFRAQAADMRDMAKGIYKNVEGSFTSETGGDLYHEYLSGEILEYTFEATASGYTAKSKFDGQDWLYSRVPSCLGSGQKKLQLSPDLLENVVVTQDMNDRLVGLWDFYTPKKMVVGRIYMGKGTIYKGDNGKYNVEFGGNLGLVVANSDGQFINTPPEYTLDTNSNADSGDSFGVLKAVFRGSEVVEFLWKLTKDGSGKDSMIIYNADKTTTRMIGEKEDVKLEV